MNSLQKVKEALEEILDDYKYNIKEYHKLTSKYSAPGYVLKVTGKTRAKEALAELNEFMEKLESDELVEVIMERLAKAYYRKNLTALGYFDDEEDFVVQKIETFRQEAQAAINVIKCNESDKLK